jgi:hypothetical protein
VAGSGASVLGALEFAGPGRLARPNDGTPLVWPKI